jgi:hypothetical protein
MAVTYRTYAGSTVNGYRWTGVNTLNQVWSYATIEQDMIVDTISVRWAGYNATAYAYHCLWNSAGTLIVNTGTVTATGVSEGTANDTWYHKACTPTFVPAGLYKIGFWCNPAYRRIWTEWSSYAYNTYNYAKTATGGISTATAHNDAQSAGVIAAQVTGEPAGQMHVYNGGWKKGNVYVYNGGWKRAKAVWAYNGGWRKST